MRWTKAQFVAFSPQVTVPAFTAQDDRERSAIGSRKSNANKGF